MASNTIPTKAYDSVFEVVHWIDKRQLQLMLTGQASKRHTRTEKVLARYTKRGKLRAVKFERRLVYSLPRKSKNFNEFEGLAKIRHGLACTECLVRTYRSNVNGMIVPEREFYGLGSVPEWGIIYPQKTMLLLEFATKSNFLFSGLMRGKMNAYKKNLSVIEQKFDAKATVLFVIDVPRLTVEKFVGTLKRDVGSVADGDQSALYGGDSFPFNPFRFTDFETFCKVPFEQQLKAPIYFWIDAKEYPLREK